MGLLYKDYIFFLTFRFLKTDKTISFLFGLISMTLSGFNLDFCLSPILIVGHLKNTAS